MALALGCLGRDTVKMLRALNSEDRLIISSMVLALGGVGLFALLAIPCTSWAAAVWSEEQRSFFEPLTYPNAQWRPDDFGVEVSTKDRALLKRFRPRIFIAPKGLPPVDFYRDYMPNTVVRGRRRKIARKAPDRTYLKSIERDPRYYLDFKGAFAPCRGLPAEIPWWKFLVGSLAGSVEIWHELDIHGAVQLYFEPGAGKAFAVAFAQHNHFRSYLFGRDLPWPEDGRIEVCYAQRSNEPYPCPSGREPRKHRAVGNPLNLRYLLTGASAPAESGVDLVFGPEAGSVEIEYGLRFLSSRDPLNVAWIPLGDRRKFFGVIPSWYRNGPPGMNMNTWPRLRRYVDILRFWYMDDGDEELVELFEKHVRGWRDADLGPILERNAAVFERRWKQSRGD